jgi:hypothetical protein
MVAWMCSWPAVNHLSESRQGQKVVLKLTKAKPISGANWVVQHRNYVSIGFTDDGTFVRISTCLTPLQFFFSVWSSFLANVRIETYHLHCQTHSHILSIIRLTIAVNTWDFGISWTRRPWFDTCGGERLICGRCFWVRDFFDVSQWHTSHIIFPTGGGDDTFIVLGCLPRLSKGCERCPLT